MDNLYRLTAEEEKNQCRILIQLTEAVQGILEERMIAFCQEENIPSMKQCMDEHMRSHYVKFEYFGL